MFASIIHYCSITIILNVKLVMMNLTEITPEIVEITETINVTERTTSTKYPSLDLYDWEVFCKFQANRHDCANDRVGSTRYYYDIKLEDCTKFVFGGCPTNQRNIFNSLKQCTDTCREPGKKGLEHQHYHANVFCRFQPDFGTCHDYHPMFYFDLTLRKCAGFSFSGCAGNQNRFKTLHDCQYVCIHAVDAYGNRDEMSEADEFEQQHDKFARIQP